MADNQKRKRESHHKLNKIKGVVIYPNQLMRAIEHFGGFQKCVDLRMMQKVREHMNIPYS